jgi:glycyl-tRNA synthetase beta chain
MSTRDLLIEIGTEELPPKTLRTLMDAFEAGIKKGLDAADLSYQVTHAYAAPRRLAVVVEGLIEKQADKLVERRGPAVASAFDDAGEPTRAVEGFAKSCGVTVADLERIATDKGEWLVFKQEQAGAETSTLLADIVEKSLQSLPIAKRMKWGDLPGEFVRPVHWLVLLFGDQVVPMATLGVTSGRESRGHRFHHPDDITITSPTSYVAQMASAYVLVDLVERREAIRQQVIELATELGGEAVMNADLLAEVTGLVEWPVALSGSYDARFLALPAEALISSMEEHQKYFAVRSKAGELLPKFITVSNIESIDPAQIIAGNERVILPRLSDAVFFWDTDRKQPLAAQQERLKTIVFQSKLGSVYDKSLRVAKLASTIAQQLGSNLIEAERAAMLAKCDLVTEMVGEFPDLQGIIGRYYAQLDNEPTEVSEALDEQYLPRYAGDKLPQTKTGQAVSLAEKLDMLVGLFGVGQPPTGVKDPFALRRAALGVLRIIIEQELDLDLAGLLAEAEKGFDGVLTETDTQDQVLGYIFDRLRGYLSDQDVKTDVFEAVLALRPSRPLDFIKRVQAVAAFRELDAAEALAAGNKRIGNILRKNEAEGEAGNIDNSLLQEPAEQALATQLEAVTTTIQPLIEASDYEGVLRQLADMRESVDAFFDSVMVMADDPAVRENRLVLLNQVRALFLGVADIAVLQA